MKYILLDTNAIYNDHFLNGTNLSSLCMKAQDMGVKVCIPEVVHREHLKDYCDAVSDAVRVAKKANRVITRVNPGSTPLEILDAASLESDFPVALKARLTALGISILDMPDLSHSKVAEWACRRRKPFKASGEGYQDALIWGTVVELVEKGISVDLITGNTKDFCSNDGFLSSDLPELADVIEKVRHFKNISSWLDHQEREFVELDDIDLQKEIEGLLRKNDAWKDRAIEEAWDSLLASGSGIKLVLPSEVPQNWATENDGCWDGWVFDELYEDSEDCFRVTDVKSSGTNDYSIHATHDLKVGCARAFDWGEMIKNNALENWIQQNEPEGKDEGFVVHLEGDTRLALVFHGPMEKLTLSSVEVVT